MTEADLRREIMIALSEDGHAVFRANVGLFFTKDGRPVSTGLPVGFSDLFGARVGDARAFFLEVKRPGADATSKKERTKKLAEMRELGATQQQLRQADEWMRLGATPDQAQFLTAMRARGAIADVVRSVDDARQLLRRPL
jgi:hypothetical protein